MRSTLIVLLLAAEIACAAPIRTLIFSGRNNHDWRTTTPFLAKLLRGSGRFDVRVVEEPAGTTAATLAGYDLLILDYQGARWGAETEKAVAGFVKSGKGLVAVHAASYAFGGLQVLGDHHVRTGLIEPPWPEYAEMLGCSWRAEAPKTGHGPRRTFTVKYVRADHPIARGLPLEFRTNDELYHNFVMKPGVEVIATAFDDAKIGGTGKDEPLLWTVRHGGGRVFHTALGHDVAAMREQGFTDSFLRGAEWAATGGVTLPPCARIRRAENPVRVELVTGGHDHDATLYPLFEGHADIVTTVNPHPDAYKGDLRKRYDVLALYDMVQEIPEKQRENLRTFVESGKGLVVLHHAIADFNSWPWWYEEVVGGKYLLKPEGGLPGSTYRHDQEENVQVAAKHPVTAGLGGFHITDETYKGKWISPRVKVLLRTDNPSDDGPVAWISPYEKSRVVYIELGHDRQAHEHPSYRALLRNAILWAAGRGAGQ